MENDFNVYAGVNRPEMMEFIPVEARSILDVGCSTGNFGETLKRNRDVIVWGIEPNSVAAEIAAQRLDKVICGVFETGLEVNQKFDCIVFNDVLEHMVDPYSALDYAKELLTRDGLLVASIPNVRFFDNIWQLLFHKDWRYQDAGILDRTHLRFFTKKSIERMLFEAGLDVVKLEGINPIETQSSYLERRYRLINRLLLNNLEDMRWLQFAIVARVKCSNKS